MRVTVDTNIFPADEIEAVGRRAGHTFVATTVTHRELRGHPLGLAATRLGEPLLELAVLDESEWSSCAWPSDDDGRRLVAIIKVITSGSFPNDWLTLSVGERRQLRDAMIFEAHCRAKNDLFITNDTKGFIAHGKREQLQAVGMTTILTEREYCERFR